VTGPARRALLALGSNLGDRRAHLRQAVDGLPDVVEVSPVYQTEPVGGPPGQGPYLNAVVCLHTALSPHDLLVAAHRAEAAAGRVRAQRWGSRTLDVDVLWVDGETVDTPELVVPHPRMWERGFVMVPLADVAPDVAAGRLTGAMRRSVRPAGTIVAATGTATRSGP
jgi:2-amino-4-hydroxy-6-hydroxymethyldihydropteridine diphosphokinase